MTRRPLALALAAALLAPAAAGAAGLRPLMLKHRSYGESFTFLADLEGGAYVHLTLSLTNLGPGSTKGICRAVVVRPDQPLWEASDRVGKDAVRWSEGPPERLDIGACYVAAAPDATEVSVQVGNGTVRLAYAAPLLRHTPHPALATLEGDRYQSDVVLDRAPVRATLALPGRPEVQLAGGGYADHSRSTIQPRDLAQRWVRFRALRGERTLLALARQALDGSFSPAWACRDGESCVELQGFTVAQSGPKLEPGFAVDLQCGGGVLQLRSSKLLFRDAPVEALGILGKLVSPFTGNPVTYVLRGTASLAGGAPVDGIIEVEFVDGE